MDWLAARGGAGVEMEDYCHSFEHTVELQVIFLQHMLGPGREDPAGAVRPFAHSIYEGGNPEDDDKVKRVLRGARRTARSRGRPAVLGAGRGYGAHGRALSAIGSQAVAGEGRMQEVSARDERRIERINALRRRRLLGPGARESATT